MELIIRLGESRNNFEQFCKVCNKETEHESSTFDDVNSITCLEHEDDDQQRYEAGEEILKLQKLNIEETIQNLLHENHTESNCNCNQPKGTAIMRSEGAEDMEICLKCFGAEGCIY